MRIRLVVHKRVGTDIKCICAALERLEGGRDVLGSPDFRCDDLEAERAGRRLNLAHLQHGVGIADIGQDRQPAETGDEPRATVRVACRQDRRPGSTGR